MNVLRLHPEGGGLPIVIEQALVRVGRDAASDVHLRDASVSRRHAEIEGRGDDWVIVDQNSGNGIRIDGQRTHEAKLLPGQQLHIGNLKFRVEIDRGDDGATMMLGRSPLLDDVTDQTLVAGGPPVFPVPPSPEEPPRSVAGPMTAVAVVVIGLAITAAAIWMSRNAKEEKVAVVPAPTPAPTLLPTATPALTPPPTPAPTRRPTGTLLISSDIATTVSIDGRVVAQLAPGSLRRFQVAPGEHIVQFEAEGWRVESVARVRVNEQTVVQRATGSAGETVNPVPVPVPSPTPQ